MLLHAANPFIPMELGARGCGAPQEGPAGAVGVDHPRIGLMEQRRIVGEVDPEAFERRRRRRGSRPRRRPRAGPASRARRSRRGSAPRFAPAAPRRPRPRARSSAPALAGLARGRTRRGRRRARRSARPPCSSPARPPPTPPRPGRPAARRERLERRRGADDAAADRRGRRRGCRDVDECGAKALYDRTVHMYTEASSPAETEPDPPAPAGRRQGSARRLLLLQTTLRLIADEGIDAVSHRAVARGGGRAAGIDHLLVLVPSGDAAPGARALRPAGDRDPARAPGGSARQGPLPPPAGRRVHRPARPAARRAALANGRAVRALPGGGASARAGAGLPRVDRGLGGGARRGLRVPRERPIPSSRRGCSWRCSTACC